MPNQNERPKYTEVVQLIVAVLVQDLAVMAGDAVADQLDVAVIPAADQHPFFAAYIHLAQDGLGGLFFYWRRHPAHW